MQYPHHNTPRRRLGGLLAVSLLIAAPLLGAAEETGPLAEKIQQIIATGNQPAMQSALQELTPKYQRCQGQQQLTERCKDIEQAVILLQQALGG